MTTRPELTPEEILRAARYLELLHHNNGDADTIAALESLHADGDALARLMGDFADLLFTDYLTVVPDEHADCDAGHVLVQLTEVMVRSLRRRCVTGGAGAAYQTAEFLIECMQSIDNVDQFLSDVRGAVHSRPAALSA